MKSLGKILILSLSALLAGNVWAADIPTANLTSVSDRLSNARNAIQSKDWSRAHAELTAAYRQEPRNADVHNLMGYAYRKQPKPDLAKAFEHYNHALKMNPRHKGAHEYIGEAYLMDNKPEQAGKHLGELEKICGNKTCEEYEDLAKAIADYKSKTK